jgi:type I restriction enzyme S subunit
MNRNKNQELTSLRDWLLPMLMSGQVTVGDAEEKVAAYGAGESVSMAAEGEGEYGDGNG